MIYLIKNKEKIKRCWKIFFINIAAMILIMIFSVIALVALPNQVFNDWKSILFLIITLSYSMLFMVSFLKLYDICELREYSASSRQSYDLDNSKNIID